MRPLPPSEVLTAELLGRNVHTVQEFVVATMKQHSDDPSAITPECPAVSASVQSAYDELLEFLWQFHGQRLERDVDVALFRLLMKRDDMRLTSFISAPNACEEEDVHESLTSRGLFNALADFYVQKKRPREALAIWKQLGEGSLQEEGVDGLSLTCKFLRNRTEPDTLELIQEFIPWVMDRNPDEGYKVFIFGEVSTVPIYKFVLHEIDRIASTSYRSSYIQYLVVMNHVDDSALTTEYIVERLRLLLQQVREQGLDVNVPTLSETPSSVRDQREQIMTFLRNNKSYDASAILSEIEDSSLFFEKVLVLARLGRYEDSLRIVIYELRSVAYACDCCQQFPPSSWYLLIRLLFSEEDEE